MVIAFPSSCGNWPISTAREEIAHQDLKPSNALIFRGHHTKIGDLGRAACRDQIAPHEDFPVPGDYSYAPPELLYGHIPADWGQRRLGCDLYLMGSMVVFFFSRVGMTSLLLDQLDDSQRWQNWTGTFYEILPHLRDAFSRAIELFSTSVCDDLKAELTVVVRQLCDPDPSLRGHSSLD
jgi:serine/threonine protein kinase